MRDASFGMTGLLGFSQIWLRREMVRKVSA